MRKTLSHFAAVALAVAALTPSFAQPVSPSIVSHADVFKAMGSGTNDKAREALVGKTYEGKLMRTGAGQLMAQFGDGVYFSCEQGTAAFKGGSIKSPIKSYETLPDGEVMVGLTHCGT